MKTVPQIRVFLASPGDVNEERAVALQVLDILEYDPLFRQGGAGGVSIHAVAWDKPGSGTAMRATLTPQTAIREGLPQPSECDIVLVLFWGRMGTPLPHPEYQKDDGSPYLSGTEWEYLNAVTAERKQGKPITLVYRRSKKPRIDIDNAEQVAQYQAVQGFFKQFRDPKTGALMGGVNEYTSPEDLRVKLLLELRDIIYRHLSEAGALSDTTTTAVRATTEELPRVAAPPLWEGSPFPGLRAFTEKDAPIFFGRGQEISELVSRVEESRFVAVVAASGSGKSSLVAAGLIPRLRANAIVSGETGSKDWRFVRLTPGQGENPFSALFGALCEAFPEHAVSPFLVEHEKDEFVASLTKNPAVLVGICNALLREAKAPAWAEILFFVDQFEELFTLVRDDADRAPFVALLQAIHNSPRLRCVVTMRSDFYANCLELPALAALLKDGTYPLSVPTAGALIEMIKRPAERAGLTWDEGLPERIQADTGSDVGALALMAYALDEMYQTSHANKRLTFAAYQAIGGVEGAIGKRAETAFANLTQPDKERLLQRVFRELVTVDERGTATRQRALLSHFDADERALIHVFAGARLLVTQDDSVEVAHEAVFRRWTWLKNWIAEAQEDLILLRQVRVAVEEWVKNSKPDYLRWPAERLKPIYEMIERQQPTVSASERDFIEPEQERLLRELDNLETTHERRRDIGDRLSVIGDNRRGVGIKVEGVPDIYWCKVGDKDAIPVSTHRGVVTVTPFFISRYLVTFVQFQAFIDAPDGYTSDLWWKGVARRPNSPREQRFKMNSAPRDTISLYEARAFCRWLSQRVGYDVKLPTQEEWKAAATLGDSRRIYPWGDFWDARRANTIESGLNRSTSVGMYLHGVSPSGVLDLSGNMAEWTDTVSQSGGIQTSENPYIVCGGSWYDSKNGARTDSGSRLAPTIADEYRGFRLICRHPRDLS